MKRNSGMTFLFSVLFCMLLWGCGNNPAAVPDVGTKTEAQNIQETKDNIEDAVLPQTHALEDGVYLADFDTDGSMFHTNETCDGKGKLTVKDGAMVIHISLPSKNIVNLYVGMAADVGSDGAVLLEPTIDSVTYSDGITEEVHGFDIPVPVLGEEFDVAILGTKGKWYDHKVKVSNPVREDTSGSLTLQDGEYHIGVTLEGGTGRATIDSPARLVVENGGYTVTVKWSSPNYDYMKIGGATFYPVNTEGNSEFELPADILRGSMDVIADTTAMGNPHEIEYRIIFDLDSIAEDGGI